MPRGPKGEYRPADALKSGMLVMRIAVGELTEDDARKLAPSKKPPRKIKKRLKARHRPSHR